VSDAFRQTAPSGGYPPDAVALGDALEAVMDEGPHDLEGIVAALNARFPHASPWTAETLAAKLHQLAELR
jgi:hypothetical protein